jgi:hypothetical protein
MDIAISVFLGIGLAAAVGFRIFLPFMIMSLAAQFGVMELSTGFEWIGNPVALVLFGTASVIEILSYYIPWFDNLLDSVTAPLAMVCGTLVMGSAMVEMEPWIKWTLAIIAGGGTAGLIKGTSSTTRAVSSVTTAGLGNPLVATIESVSSIGLSLLSIFIPVIAILVVLGLVILIFRKFWRLRSSP